MAVSGVNRSFCWSFATKYLVNKVENWSCKNHNNGSQQRKIASSAKLLLPSTWYRYNIILHVTPTASNAGTK